MVFQKGFTKKRWDKSRKLQKLHEEQTGEKIGLKSFYKNENPFTKEIYKYEVSFEMNYKGDDYEFFIPQESFTLFGYGAINNEDEIRSKVKDAIGSTFRGDSRAWVSERVEVNPRGFEKQRVAYDEINVNQLSRNNVYVENVPSFDVGKGKTSGRANKNNYKLDIWL